MTTSLTVFPTPVVAEILRAMLALTGLSQALVAVPNPSGWRVEAATGTSESPSFQTDWVQSTAFCDHVRRAGTAVGMPVLLTDDEIVDCPRVPYFGAASYVAAPLITVHSVCIGVLCAYGDRTGCGYPTGTAETVSVFANSLVAQARLAPGTPVVGDSAMGLRKVLSVVGHDVRNPMHSLLVAIEMLKSKPLDPRALRLLGMVETSALRLGELAKGVVDFARLQLIGDLAIHPVVDAPLQTTLDKVVAEACLAFPQRAVTATWIGVVSATCDIARVSEAFSAVLSHALKHAEHDRPVTIHGYRDDTGAIMIEVDVPGYILPVELLPHVFDPFYTMQGDPRVAQLGISLYLASAVARAHEGSLCASALNDGAARFTMRLPAAAL
jgi:GAF domain-containing protein